LRISHIAPGIVESQMMTSQRSRFFSASHPCRIALAVLGLIKLGVAALLLAITVELRREVRSTRLPERNPDRAALRPAGGLDLRLRERRGGDPRSWWFRPRASRRCRSSSSSAVPALSPRAGGLVSAAPARLLLAVLRRPRPPITLRRSGGACRPDEGYGNVCSTTKQKKSRGFGAANGRAPKPAGSGLDGARGRR